MTHPRMPTACSADTSNASDWERLIHIAKYLNKTKDESLVFKFGGKTTKFNLN